MSIDLRRLHEEQIKVLKAFMEIAEKNNLTYFLAGGTLLGAIRHSGFIPWDDDIDIWMPRKDYKVLSKVVDNNEIYPFFLETPVTDKYYDGCFFKFLNRETLLVEAGAEKRKHMHCVSIDVFPLDECSKKETIHPSFKIKIASALDASVKSKRIGLKTNPKIALFKIVPEKLAIRIRDKLFEGCGDYYVNYAGAYDISHESHPKELYYPIRYLEFEGIKCPAPCRSEDILCRTYGRDFMELPPAEKRRTHNIVVFKA